MLLVLGSILFFSYLILTYQYLTIQNIDFGLVNEAIIAAPSIEQLILDKIQDKAFDDNWWFYYFNGFRYTRFHQ